MRPFVATLLLIAVPCTVGTTACGGSTNGDIPVPSFDAGAREDRTGPPDVISADVDASPELDDASQNDTALGETSVDAPEPSCLTCAVYGTVTTAGPVPPKLPELSGLAASRRHPGILYAHNDSGDSARFFAINEHAELQAEMDLTGAIANDWEDIAVGPCPSGSCVYLGDIGDNNLRRAEYTIYRVAEPETLPAGEGLLTVAYERFPYVYPDGPHNAETLLVHPATGRVFVATKINGVPSTVYELPLPLTPDVTAMLVRVTAVNLPATAGLVTGGSFHPCADRMLLRTYGGVYEFSAPATGPLDGIFTADPISLPVAAEVQGEAVTYSYDGNSYFTSSETVAGMPPAVLSFVSCQ